MSSQPSGWGYYIALKCQNTVMQNHIPSRTESPFTFCYLKQNVAIGNIMSMKGTIGNRPWEPMYWKIPRVDFHVNERNNSYIFTKTEEKLKSVNFSLHYTQFSWIRVLISTTLLPITTPQFHPFVMFLKISKFATNVPASIITNQKKYEHFNYFSEC